MTRRTPQRLGARPTQTMNLVGLGAVLTVLCCTLTAAFAAYDQHAGWWSLLSAVGGFLLGLPVALAFGKLACAVLHRSGSGIVGVLCFVTYLLLPLVAVGASIAATLFLSSVLLHRFH